MTLSTEEITKKCKGGHPGVCDLLADHEGPHRSANGFVLDYDCTCTALRTDGLKLNETGYCFTCGKRLP